uniref:cytochrome c biogenesis CcdA family protein n=1 Tax=Pararhizobium sp. IMCC3301 TaxID=3067904 RepID=UPI0027423B80|nr:cytochrome c biogenesis CcdA family protein [Pararhizobium sp. IMCC3301]
MELTVSLSGAAAAGLLSFVSPCVLPLVPPYLCFLAGVSLDELTDEQRPPVLASRIIIASLFFVFGFATVFVALGASASLIGAFVTEYLTILSYVAGAIIIVLGLHFLGVFRIGLLFREARFQPRNKPLGFLGAYVIGLAFAFGWTPCVGPVLATILLIAASGGNAWDGALLLFAYALGIGIPFILAAFFAGPFMRFMSRFRSHMALIEKIMGGVLVATGLLFLTGSMQTLSYLLLEWFPAFGQIG